MKHTLWTSVSFGVAMAFSAVAANAFTLTGKVKDESGAAVQDADVTLVQKKLSTKTDADGVFSFHKEDRSHLPSKMEQDHDNDKKFHQGN